MPIEFFKNISIPKTMPIMIKIELYTLYFKKMPYGEGPTFVF